MNSTYHMEEIEHYLGKIKYHLNGIKQYHNSHWITLEVDHHGDGQILVSGQTTYQQNLVAKLTDGKAGIIQPSECSDIVCTR